MQSPIAKLQENGMIMIMIMIDNDNDNDNNVKGTLHSEKKLEIKLAIMSGKQEQNSLGNFQDISTAIFCPLKTVKDARAKL